MTQKTITIGPGDSFITALMGAVSDIEKTDGCLRKPANLDPAASGITFLVKCKCGKHEEAKVVIVVKDNG